MMSCKCDLRTRAVGDGCRYCNPQHYIDILEDQTKDDCAELDKLEETIRTQQSTIDRLTEQLAEVEAIKALQAEQESQLQKMKELFLAVTGQRDRLVAALDVAKDRSTKSEYAKYKALIAEVEAGK